MKSAETKRRTKKKKRSVSKIIITIIMTLTVIVTLFALYATWLIRDASILVTLIPCLFVETGVVSGFYMWKSKVLSVIELKRKYGEQFIEDTLDDV